MFQIIPPYVFPTLRQARWAYTNLNAAALSDATDRPDPAPLGAGLYR
jgi:hypothetical protein